MRFVRGNGWNFGFLLVVMLYLAAAGIAAVALAHIRG